MAAFKIYDLVNTVYGTGYVANIRDDCYVVLLTHWKLAQKQSPTLYLQAESMTLIPGALPGSVVSTVYGPAHVKKVRADGVHIARPINWKLANDTSATLYLQPEAVKLTQTKGLTEGDEVMTVYGQGYIKATREKEGDLVVLLNEWKLAQKQSPTCYLQASSVVKIPGFKIGAEAKTVWGLVRILDIRRDGTHVAEAVHWNLADGKPPRMYLAPEAFALMSLKP